jgi:hypothetical protein
MDLNEWSKWLSPLAECEALEESMKTLVGDEKDQKEWVEGNKWHMFLWNSCLYISLKSSKHNKFNEFLSLLSFWFSWVTNF